jgi:hypothetical protein
MDDNKAKWKKNSQGKDNNGSQLVNLKQNKTGLDLFEALHHICKKLKI